MKTGKAALIGALWIASLCGVALWAQNGQGANARVPAVTQPQLPAGTVQQPTPVVRAGQPYGPVISGDDIGFQRVFEPNQDGRVIGRIVVKINGEWLPIASPMTVVR